MIVRKENDVNIYGWQDVRKVAIKTFSQLGIKTLTFYLLIYDLFFIF